MEDYRLTQTGQEVQDILDGAAMQSDLTAEKERAELAEQTLQGNIDNEALARQQQDGTLDGKIDANTARIVSIEGKIPSGASTENKLATELYVNSSVATNTATFRGTYNLVSDLHLSIDATNEQIAYMLAATIATADNNDYCFVQFPTSAETPTEIRKIARFKYNGEAWGFEYDLNNSGFTSDQWAAINSGITSGNVAKLAALPTSVELTALLNGKQNTLTFDTAPTPGSTNPVTSGGIHTAIDNEKGARQNADTSLQQAIDGILALIPSAATALNQLADKLFVNSSIATNTATFRGTFNLVSDLHLAIDATHDQIATVLAASIATADNNDYCYVQIPTSATTPTEIAKTERYKFNGTAWAFEYDLNNSGFTANQWAAINSGITAALVTKLGDLPTATELANQFTAITNLIPSEATALNQLADKAYVLAQILAATPAFKGQFTTLADLQAVASPKAGDLGIVRTKDSDGYDVFTFYQYLNSTWNVFYTLAHHPQTKPATTGTTGDYPYNGMGRVVLPMNIKEIGGVTANYLEQSMMPTATGGNTIYVITHDYVLATDITIPANCVLEFDGGSVSGSHTLIGNNTRIEAGGYQIFGTGLVPTSGFVIPYIDIRWFGAKSDLNTEESVSGTDASAAIQRAIDWSYYNYCLPLYIEGAFYIGNTINCKDSLVLKGCRVPGRVLIHENGVTSPNDNRISTLYIKPGITAFNVTGRGDNANTAIINVQNIKITSVWGISEQHQWIGENTIFISDSACGGPSRPFIFMENEVSGIYKVIEFVKTGDTYEEHTCVGSICRNNVAGCCYFIYSGDGTYLMQLDIHDNVIEQNAKGFYIKKGLDISFNNNLLESNGECYVYIYHGRFSLKNCYFESQFGDFIVEGYSTNHSTISIQSYDYNNNGNYRLSLTGRYNLEAKTMIDAHIKISGIVKLLNTFDIPNTCIGDYACFSIPNPVLSKNIIPTSYVSIYNNRISTEYIFPGVTVGFRPQQSSLEGYTTVTASGGDLVSINFYKGAGNISARLRAGNTTAVDDISVDYDGGFKKVFFRVPSTFGNAAYGIWLRTPNSQDVPLVSNYYLANESQKTQNIGFNVFFSSENNYDFFVQDGSASSPVIYRVLLPKYSYTPFLFIAGNSTNVNSYMSGAIAGGGTNSNPTVFLNSGSVSSNYGKLYYDTTYLYIVAAYNCFFSTLGKMNLGIEKISELPSGVTEVTV